MESSVKLPPELKSRRLNGLPLTLTLELLLRLMVPVQRIRTVPLVAMEEPEPSVSFVK